jgi:hypothetical protein
VDAAIFNKHAAVYVGHDKYMNEGDNESPWGSEGRVLAFGRSPRLI